MFCWQSKSGDAGVFIVMVFFNRFVNRLYFLETAQQSFAALFEVVGSVGNGVGESFESGGDHEQVIASVFPLHCQRLNSGVEVVDRGLVPVDLEQVQEVLHLRHTCALAEVADVAEAQIAGFPGHDLGQYFGERHLEVNELQVNWVVFPEVQVCDVRRKYRDVGQLFHNPFQLLAALQQLLVPLLFEPVSYNCALIFNLYTVRSWSGATHWGHEVEST